MSMTQLGIPLSFEIQFPTGQTIACDLAGWEMQLQEFQRFGQMSVYSLSHSDCKEVLCMSLAGAWPLFPQFRWTVQSMTYQEFGKSPAVDHHFVLQDGEASIRCTSFRFWTSTRMLMFCGSDISPWSKDDTTLCCY